jgi:hypothetical protein
MAAVWAAGPEPIITTLECIFRFAWFSAESVGDVVVETV